MTFDLILPKIHNWRRKEGRALRLFLNNDAVTGVSARNGQPIPYMNKLLAPPIEIIYNGLYK